MQSFAAGPRDPERDGADAEALAEAASRRAADVAVVFLGLPDSYESEGFDRTHIELPAEQVALLEAVVAVAPRPSSSSATARPSRPHGGDRRRGGPRFWLPGRPAARPWPTCCSATSPSGKLAETVPCGSRTHPSFLDFPGEHGHVTYGEGIHVGYRYYDARDLAVDFPFGHGLSYTTSSTPTST